MQLDRRLAVGKALWTAADRNVWMVLKCSLQSTGVKLWKSRGRVADTTEGATRAEKDEDEMLGRVHSQVGAGAGRNQEA